MNSYQTILHVFTAVCSSCASRLAPEQSGWKVILCYSEDEQVNKLIFFSDHKKAAALFVWFLKMYWPLMSMELHCFLCVAPKTPATRPPCLLSITPCLWFLRPEFDILQLLYVAAGSTPYWLCPHTLRHVHTCGASPFLSVILTPPSPPTLPLDTACIDCVPKEGLVFYITYDILLDPPVAPISVSGFCSTTSTLVVALAMEGCWHSSLSVALTLNKPVLSNWPTSYWYTDAVSNSLQQQSSIAKIPRNLHLPIYSSWRWWAVLLFNFKSIVCISFLNTSLSISASISQLPFLLPLLIS